MLEKINDYNGRDNLENVVWDDLKSKVKSQVISSLDNSWLKNIQFWEDSFFIREYIWKWEVLLDKDWKQISPKWIYYKNIWFRYFEETWLILVETEQWFKIINKELIDVSPKWKYYKDILYDHSKKKFYYEMLGFKKFFDI